MTEPWPGPTDAADLTYLDEITRGLQHAASSANDLLSQQYMRALDQFFDWDDGAGQMRAKTVTIDMGSHEMKVPLVALSTPRGLYMDRMVVHLTVRHQGTQLKEVQDSLVTRRSRSVDFAVNLAPRMRDDDPETGPLMDIELQFASLNPPEALQRIIDEFANQVLPSRRTPDPAKPAPPSAGPAGAT